MPSDTQVQEAIAFLQKTGSTDSSSVYDSLTKLVTKASGWPG